MSALNITPKSAMERIAPGCRCHAERATWHRANGRQRPPIAHRVPRGPRPGRSHRGRFRRDPAGPPRRSAGCRQAPRAADARSCDRARRRGGRAPAVPGRTPQRASTTLRPISCRSDADAETTVDREKRPGDPGCGKQMRNRFGDVVRGTDTMSGKSSNSLLCNSACRDRARTPRHRRVDQSGHHCIDADARRPFIRKATHQRHACAFGCSEVRQFGCGTRPRARSDVAERRGGVRCETRRAASCAHRSKPPAFN